MESNVNHPKHYAGVPVTVECIDVTRHLPFSLGNAVKYLWRAGKKGGPEKEIEDLEKAKWYLKDWKAWQRLSPEKDFFVARIIFQMISQGDMENFRIEAIGHVLRGDMLNSEEEIDRWIAKRIGDIQNENR